MRVTGTVLGGVLLFALVSAAPAATAEVAVDEAAVITSIVRQGERRLEVRIDSLAVGPTAVTLLLPSSFEAEPDSTWPVLFLLHGATNDHTTWTEQTDVETLTEDLDALVVMPDGGEYGFYSDWWHDGQRDLPRWETYHLGELPRLLEREFRAGDVRAIAGLSMGGFGAIAYAARHPGMFRAAASFSGVLDIDALGNRFGAEIWGDRDEQAENWRAHDPVSLAAALEGTDLYIAWGNGEPGPLDDEDARFDVLEAWLAAGNRRFVDRLAELDVPATVDDYGPGTHIWPYWERALQDALPMLTAALQPDPSS